MQLFINRFNHKTGIQLFFSILLLFGGYSAKAQCYPDIYAYRTYPSGVLCSPQSVTVRIEYDNEANPNQPVNGLLRWYMNEGDATPAQTNNISSSGSLYADFSFYANNGTTIWYSYYDYNTQCQTGKYSYTVSMASSPNLYQNNRYCGDNIGHVQVSSDAPGVTFQLYYENPQNFTYQFLQSNTTGNFDISGFNPNDLENYYVKIYNPNGCTVDNYYYQLVFATTDPTAPSITGNTTGCTGAGVTLSASAFVNGYRWYDGSGTLVHDGAQYTTSSTLAAGTYNYQVVGYSHAGCVTNPAQITTTISPRPVNGTIAASATTIHYGDMVNITSQGGTGDPHYWCSSNGGATWNVFQDDNVGTYTFIHTPPAIGTYRYLLRNKTGCGFCSDQPGGCTDPYIDVNVIYYPPIQIVSVTPAYQLIAANGTASALTVNGVSNGSGTYTYQWQSSATSNFANATNINGANSATYTPAGVISKTYYRVVISSPGTAAPAYSPVAVVDVYPQLTGNAIIPGNYTIPAGTKPGKLSAGSATGGNCNGAYQYQWQVSSDGVNWTDITGAQDLIYEPDVLSATAYYRRHVHCGNDDAYTNVCQISIGTMDVENMNYIRTRSFMHGGITDEQTAAAIDPVAEVKQMTEYFDGLGRSMQTVAKQAGKDGKDVVIPIFYDDFGRQPLSYLPYVSAATDGNYKQNPLADLNGFHKIQSAGESFYYSQTVFESSPLNRVQKTMAPGDSWTGSGRGATNQYEVNTAVDDVRIWNVNNVANDWATYSMDGVYSPGTLYKNITTDEKGNQVIEFKDKDDQVLLKKVQLTAAPDDGTGAGYTNWLCTYYVYDDMNLLRAVIQPRGVELLIQNGWDITALGGNILNEQCFRYEYDGRNRMIRKKAPGAGDVYMIYDIRDRLVFTQDANLQLQNQWLTTLYDNQNRQVTTGLMSWTGTPAVLQQNVTAQTTNGFAYDLVLKDPNTQGDYQAVNTITLDNGFESATTPDFTAEIATGGTGSSNVTFVNSPIPNGAGFTVLTQTGYDNYTAIPTQSGLTGDIDNTYTGSNYLNTSYNSFPYADPVAQSKQTTGLLTWTQTKVLGTTNQYIYKVMLYDEKGRVVQVKGKNNTGGADVTTSQYTFSNQPLVIIQKQEKAGSANPQTHIVVTKTTYNNLGQITAVAKSINSTINGLVVSKPELEIITNEYDPLGRLEKKNLGKKKDPATNGTTYTTDPIQSLTYEYNIRNWILGVNRSYLVTEGQTNDGILFGYELGYDKITNKADHNFTASEYSGNICGMLWKSDGDDIRRKYDFAYDAANRLLKGDFTQQNGDDHQWNNSKVNFSMMVGDISGDPAKAYDANGNILHLQQWGLKLDGNAPIDNMLYDYYNNGNKLKAITEQGSSAVNFKLGDFTDNYTGGNDYGYDANGNMVIDKNKRINGTAIPAASLTGGGAITYNHLNLPQQISIQDDNNHDKGTISYVYDATGDKLQKIVKEKSVSVTYNNTPFISDVTTTTTYLGEFVYESKAYDLTDLRALQYTDKLQFLNQEEGRVRYQEAVGQKPAHYEYDYFIKDYLGNVRMVLTEELQQDIYPAVTLEGNISNATDAVYTENQYYNIDPAKIVDKNDPNQPVTGITDYINKNGGPDPLDPPVNNNSNSNVSANSQKLYKLIANSSGGVTGLGITLKVMSGDKIDVYGKSYYFDNNTSGNNYDVPVLDILTGLLGAPTGATATKATTAQALNVIPDVYNGVSGFLSNSNRGDDGSIPKAYINWILLDDNFKYVTGSFERVSKPNEVEDHKLLNIPVAKNGYLYVYVSNQSPVKVFFDNLQVIHTHGPLLEETHYYPFGLTMAGISSKALNKLNNKHGFNGKEKQDKEFSDGNGLDWYDYHHRFYDNQVGRFFCVDRLADQYAYYSPYQFAGNRVTIANDVDGDEPSYMINADGNLTDPMKTLLHAAFGYSMSSMDKTTWRETKLLTDRSAVTIYRTVFFSYVQNKMPLAPSYAQKWAKLIAHEMEHRDEIGNNAVGALQWYKKYIMGYLAAGASYEGNASEQRGYGAGDQMDRLLSFGDGIVLKILDPITSVSGGDNARLETLNYLGLAFAASEESDKLSSMKNKLNNFGGSEKAKHRLEKRVARQQKVVDNLNQQTGEALTETVVKTLSEVIKPKQ